MKTDLVIPIAFVLFLLAGFGLVRHERSHYFMNGDRFYQVGMMQYQVGSDVVYIPVFKKQ